MKSQRDHQLELPLDYSKRVNEGVFAQLANFTQKKKLLNLSAWWHHSRMDRVYSMINKLDDFTDYSQLIKIDVEGYEEFVLNGASEILNHPKTNALIVELAGLNRYGSSNEIVHNLLMENNFSPIKYSPYERVIKKLTSWRDDQFNTIYIRDEKLVRKRIINSPKYKIGNQWI